MIIINRDGILSTVIYTILDVVTLLEKIYNKGCIYS